MAATPESRAEKKWRLRLDLVLFALLIFSICGNAQSSKERATCPANEITLNSGTGVVLRVKQGVSRDSPLGHPVELEAADVIRAGGRLPVILRGAAAGATLRAGTSTDRVLGRRGGWALEIGWVEDITGRRVLLRGTAAVELEDYLGGPNSWDILPRGVVVNTVVTEPVCFDATLPSRLLAEEKNREFKARLAAGKGSLHVYRNKQLTVRLDDLRLPYEREITIQIDGGEIARLQENQLVTVLIAAGKHVIRSRGSAKAFNLEAGEEMYFRINELPFNSPVDVVENDAAEEEIDSKMEVAPRAKRRARGVAPSAH